MTREEQIIKASQLYAKHQQKPFMDGALWADAHSKDNPLEGILIHGNNDAYRLGYKKAVEKACEWLYNRQQVDLVVPNIEKFINDFKKAMEE